MPTLTGAQVRAQEGFKIPHRDDPRWLRGEIVGDYFVFVHEQPTLVFGRVSWKNPTFYICWQHSITRGVCVFKVYRHCGVTYYADSRDSTMEVARKTVDKDHASMVREVMRFLGCTEREAADKLSGWCWGYSANLLSSDTVKTSLEMTFRRSTGIERIVLPDRE